MAFKIELKDDMLFIDGFPKTENDFIELIREALHHHIIFENFEEITFFVDKISENWVVKLPAIAPVSFKYFYFYMMNMLRKNGSVATLLQDTYWLDRR